MNTATELTQLRLDFAAWLLRPEQGKSHNTAKTYAGRVLRWLKSDLGSMEFIEAGYASEKHIRWAALRLLATYPEYRIERAIVLPEVIDTDGELRPLLDEFRLWLKANGFRRPTVTKYALYVKQALRWMEANPAIKNFRYQGFIAGSSCEAVRNDKLKALRKFKLFMEQEYPGDLRTPGWLPQMSAAHARPPVYLSADEAYKVGQYLRYRCSRLSHAAWSLTYGCGMRICEVQNVTLDDFLWGDDCSVRILDSKNGVSREVPVPSQTQAAVRGYIEFERHERARFAPESDRRLFMGPRGNEFRARAVRDDFHAALATIGTHRIHQPLHMWRFLYATHISEQMRAHSGAVDWQALAKLLGHKSIVTTQVYVGEVSHEVLRGAAMLHPLDAPIDKWKTDADLRRARQASLEVAAQFGQNQLRSSSNGEFRDALRRRTLVS